MRMRAARVRDLRRSWARKWEQLRDAPALQNLATRGEAAAVGATRSEQAVRNCAGLSDLHAMAGHGYAVQQTKKAENKRSPGGELIEAHMHMQTPQHCDLSFKLRWRLWRARVCETCGATVGLILLWDCDRVRTPICYLQVPQRGGEEHLPHLGGGQQAARGLVHVRQLLPRGLQDLHHQPDLHPQHRLVRAVTTNKIMDVAWVNVSFGIVKSLGNSC